MPEQATGIRLHRFGDCVAFHADQPDCPTIYLPKYLARALARELYACASDIDSKTFSRSTYSTVTIGRYGESK